MPDPDHVSLAQFATNASVDCCGACYNSTYQDQCVAWTVNHAQRKCHLWTKMKRTEQGACDSGVGPAFTPSPPSPLPPTPAPAPAPTPAPAPAPAGALNVLFFAVDDLRPDLGSYGASWVHSPHTDRLASKNGSALFQRMYTAVSVCGPARSAILTGRRADSTHCWSLSGTKEYWRDYLPNAYSLPQYFKENGYLTLGMGKFFPASLYVIVKRQLICYLNSGKLFHPGSISGNNDVNHSWSPGIDPSCHGGVTVLLHTAVYQFLHAAVLCKHGCPVQFLQYSVVDNPCLIGIRHDSLTWHFLP